MARTLMLLGTCALAGCFHAAPYSPAASQARWRAIRSDAADPARPDASTGGPGVTVDEAYAMALRRNPDLAALEARASAAAADVGAQRQIDNPQLRLTGFNVDDVIANQTTMNIGLRVPIPRPGTVHARVEGAKQIARSEASLTDDAKRRLRAVIETHYAQLAKHRADLELVAQGTTLRTQRRDEVVARAALGAATELDVALAEVALSESAQDEADVRDELAAVEGELLRITGAAGPVAFATSPDMLRPVAVDLDRDRLTERAMATRPELRGTHARVVEAKADAYLAKSEAWPWFDWAQVQYRAAPGSRPSAFGFGVALTLPIFSWNRGAIRSARASLRAREQEDRAQIVLIAGEVERATDRVERTARRVASIERDVLPQIEGAGRQLELAIGSGVFDPAAVNEIDTRMIDAKRLHLAALLEHREAVIELEMAVGGRLAAAEGRTRQ